MKQRLLSILVLCAALVSLVPAAGAQGGFPPTIFKFESDLAAISMDNLEAGTVSVTLSWHVAHVTDEHWIVLDVYMVNGWVSLAGREAGLPPVGSESIQVEHPLTFNAPTYRLSVVDDTGAALDQRTLVIPFEENAVLPVIESFTAEVDRVDPAALEDGSARVVVAWEISQRLPGTNLVFEQLLSDTTAQNVELPRTSLWIPSTGQGMVAPVPPQDGGPVRLLLRVMDVITAEVYVEQMLTLGVGDAVIDAGTEPAATESSATEPSAPTASPEPTAQPPELAIGDLAVQQECLDFPTDPLRGWVDGLPVLSPDGMYAAQVFNPTGDAKIIITPADGSPQTVIRAPNLSLPIGPGVKWSPGGSRLAFTNFALSAPGGGTIYVMNPDGTGLAEVVTYVGYHDDITWSSDGNQLYFTSGTTQGEGSSTTVIDYKVYAVNVSGGAAQPVADGCGIAR
ncbi:MAG: PD40 domain-containing protein [Anaerolineae bacterium]|nr:PD40 domain-containing protein [Anaerolineae bacterium]